MGRSARQKAVSYLRVSGKGQVEGDGFPRQRQAVERFARSNGYHLVAEFRDEGVSGSTTREIEDRPGLSDLIARIASNGVRVVLVERADRIGRDLVVSEMILAELRDLGVQVISADGAVDLTLGDDNPTATLIRQVLGAVSQFDKAVIRGKLKAARIRQRKATGRCEGRKPFGARPGEAETVARIRSLWRKPRNRPRRSFGEIARTLNAEGHPTRSGKPWNPGTVRGIIARGV